MAFLLHTAPVAELPVQQVSAVQVQAAAAPTYRCAGCGELLHFNSLSTTCRCVDECYGEPTSSVVKAGTGS